LGTIVGIIYIFLSIRQNIFTWPSGILTSVLYVIVFYQSKFYAGMGLQVYYVAISIYGWFYWMKGSKKGNEHKVPVIKASKKALRTLVATTILIYGVILLILIKFTDSPVPFMDSLTTSLSIVATWMLARKIVETWLVWIVADILCTGLYLYQGLLFTSILFLVYTIMAFAGYLEWNKDLKSNG
jgi:nicotinamide mononucleotide transporter